MSLAVPGMITHGHRGDSNVPRNVRNRFATFWASFTALVNGVQCS
jgi:hypothetical protein